MQEFSNEFGMPIGYPLENWEPCQRPPHTEMRGEHCTLVPLDPEQHASELHNANLLDKENRIWVYMPYGPFNSEDDYRDWMNATCLGDDPQFYAVIDSQAGQAAGVASFLRIVPELGVIEVGHINLAPPLQRTIAATEIMYLLMCRVFDELGYRRFEWKCDSKNEKSCNAATRLGFTYEGTFRKAALYKGRNRDTVWYSMTDSEWPAIKAGFTKWLAPTNFDSAGKQGSRLSNFIERKQ